MSYLRIHTSDAPALKAFHGGEVLQKPGMKPQGLWWAVDDAWIAWAEREDYGIGANTFKLDVDKANILIIGRDMSLEEFDRKFAHDAPQGLLGRSSYSIDWKRVAESWGGIEIPVYDWHARNSLLWYYGWDVASGCLWSQKVLRGWERIERSAVPVKERTPA